MRCFTDALLAFEAVDFALLVGARPRGPGMERKDLLAANAAIFKEQGAALDRVASKNVKVCVLCVGVSLCLYSLGFVAVGWY